MFVNELTFGLNPHQIQGKRSNTFIIVRFLSEILIVCHVISRRPTGVNSIDQEIFSKKKTYQVCFTNSPILHRLPRAIFFITKVTIGFTEQIFKKTRQQIYRTPLEHFVDRDLHFFSLNFHLFIFTMQYRFLFLFHSIFYSLYSEFSSTFFNFDGKSTIFSISNFFLHFFFLQTIFENEIKRTR